jgi:hypothetical protein
MSCPRHFSENRVMLGGCVSSLLRIRFRPALMFCFVFLVLVLLSFILKSHQCTASSGGTLCMEYVPSLLVLEEHLQFANHEWKIKNGKILIFVY